MTAIAEVTDSTITVFVPIEVRRRNGRPKIVLPANGSPEQDLLSDPAGAVVIRAIARAWAWRRRLDSGEVSTLQDIADAEKITLPFISRSIRLAYVSPLILERVVAQGERVPASLNQLAATALEPWADQLRITFPDPAS
jgi:hypothetical protein